VKARRVTAARRAIVPPIKAVMAAVMLWSRKAAPTSCSSVVRSVMMMSLQ
jgi:hypothetical protein